MKKASLLTRTFWRNYSSLSMWLSHPLMKVKTGGVLKDSTPNAAEALAVKREQLVSKGSSLVDALRKQELNVQPHHLTRIMIAAAKKKPERLASWLNSAKISAEAKATVLNNLPAERLKAVVVLLSDKAKEEVLPLSSPEQLEQTLELFSDNQILKCAKKDNVK